MTKNTVHYDVAKSHSIVEGASAVVWPIDHPSELVSNTKQILTTTVLKYSQETGEFETLNTIYIPR